MSTIRIASIGDVHANARSCSWLDQATNRQTSVLDAISALDQAVRSAIKMRVSAIAIGGDLMNDQAPKPEELEMVADVLRLASQASIPVHIVPGNHEINGLPTGHRTCLWRLNDIPGVTVSEQPARFDIDGVSLYMVPWAHVSDLKGTSIRDWMMTTISALAKGDKSEHRLLVGHADLKDAAMTTVRRGSEQVLSKMVTHDGLDPDEFAELGVTTSLLNHIHVRQVVAGPAELRGLVETDSFSVPVGEPLALYNGSLARVDFSEEGHDKTFTVVEYGASKKVTVKFVPVETRDMQTIWLDHAAQMSEQPRESAIVRLRYDSAVTPAELSAARRTISEAGCRILRLEAIKSNVETVAAGETAPSRRDNAYTETMTVRDALVRWLQEEFPDDPARRMAVRGSFRSLAADEVLG